jgi:hypothetical protein
MPALVEHPPKRHRLSTTAPPAVSQRPGPRDPAFSSSAGEWTEARVLSAAVVAISRPVVAGYTPSPKNFHALVIGYYEENGNLLWEGALPQVDLLIRVQSYFFAFNSLV